MRAPERAKSGRKMTFIPVDDHLPLKDAAMTVDLYHVIANSHMADALFAYVPEHKMIIEGNIATAADKPARFPQTEPCQEG